MSDMLMIIYNALNSNYVVKTFCGNRIKFYEYPETADTTQPFLIIDPLDVPNPAWYGSNENLAFEYTYQIDIQGHDLETVKIIAESVRQEMRNIGFEQIPGGLDEYFHDTKRYVDARRYSANIKNNEVTI